eukprot:TRINITY_DN8164_c2_g1_i1.p1 TRINITY_DN8164_c2_g1~~TRINITY_DN8164_c2_g1_i1.p1  ORF type:complete len:170 (+),score=21.92 TRINITY_DN8164_c2_g1_i1:136-645(+)
MPPKSMKAAKLSAMKKSATTSASKKSTSVAKTMKSTLKTKAAASSSSSSSQAPKPKIYSMLFAKLYPLYIAKASKKGRSKDEIDEIIRWLTGYTQKRLKEMTGSAPVTIEAFFSGAAKTLNPKRKLITGKVCGLEVSEVADPVMREIRYLDKLVDELAAGKAMDKILRK